MSFDNDPEVAQKYDLLEQIIAKKKYPSQIKITKVIKMPLKTV